MQAVTINKWLISAARTEPVADMEHLPLDPVVREDSKEEAALMDTSVTDKAIPATLTKQTALQEDLEREVALRDGSREAAEE